MIPSTERQGRIIAHIDMDCFYCQVEHIRLNIPQNEPLAVQQWQMLVAVNYPAREKGIKRGDTADFAKKACPNIHLIHVENVVTKNMNLQKESEQKISLERYRRASSEILSIISANCSHVERASIDEAYFELTEEVSFALRHLGYGNLTKKNCDIQYHILESRNMIESDQLCKPDSTLADNINKDSILSELKDSAILNIVAMTSDEFLLRPEDATFEELALLIGSLCVYRIRRNIYEKLGYTTSAGISFNKLLSKIVSSKFKPNKQAIVLRRNRDNLLSSVSLKKIRGLGGKLGKIILADFPYISTPRELQSVELPTLKDRYGEATGAYIWRLCRGISDDPVVPNLKPKSMLASKQFLPQYDLTLLQRWLYVMSEELNERILNDLKKFSRRPRTISLHHKRKFDGKYSSRSRSSAIQRGTLDHGVPDVNEIYIAGCQLMDRIPVQELTPCVNLALGVYDFEDISIEGNRITEYFKTKGDKKASKLSPTVDKLYHKNSEKPQNLIGTKKIDNIACKKIDHENLEACKPIEFPNSEAKTQEANSLNWSSPDDLDSPLSKEPLIEIATCHFPFQNDPRTLCTANPFKITSSPEITSIPKSEAFFIDSEHYLSKESLSNFHDNLTAEFSEPLSNKSMLDSDSESSILLYSPESETITHPSIFTKESDLTFLKCEQCGQLLKSCELQIHLDHHLAVHLSEKDKIPDTHIEDSPFEHAQSRSKKRKSKPPKEKMAKTKTLHHFFKDFRRNIN